MDRNAVRNVLSRAAAAVRHKEEETTPSTENRLEQWTVSRTGAQIVTAAQFLRHFYELLKCQKDKICPAIVP